MERNILVAIILMFLLSPIYSMSDDGGNVPVVKNENTVEEAHGEQHSSSLLDQSTEIKSHETVKDESGIDTGLSKKGLENFKQNYMNFKAKILPNSNSDMLYNFKVDLNKYDEFKTLGVDLKRSGVSNEATTYLENTLYSDIVVLGMIVGTEIVAGSDTPKYKIKIDEILKGKEILQAKLGYIPEYIHFISGFASGYWVSDDNQPVLNHKGIYFLWNARKFNKNKMFFQRNGFSTILYSEKYGIIYEKNYEDVNTLDWLQNKKDKSDNFIKTQEELENAIESNTKWENVVSKIKEIIRLNDSINFYKKIFESR